MGLKTYRQKPNVEAVEVSDELYRQILDFHSSDDTVPLDELIAERTFVMNGVPCLRQGDRIYPPCRIECGLWLVFHPNGESEALYPETFDEHFELVETTIPEPDKLAALVRLGEKAARAALLRQKELDNESYEMTGPLEHQAERAEADLIKAGQEYFQQFPEVAR
jgi:hypothetical protein